MSPRITVLQAPGEDLIQSGSRNNPELAEPRYRMGELPSRYSHPHATLNDRRKTTHTIESSMSAPFRLSEFCINFGNVLHAHPGLGTSVEFGEADWMEDERPESHSCCRGKNGQPEECEQNCLQGAVEFCFGVQ